MLIKSSCSPLPVCFMDTILHCGDIDRLGKCEYICYFEFVLILKPLKAFSWIYSKG